MKNKKAASGDIYLSPWMFLVWIIVAVSIIIGVLIFLSGQLDVRKTEASALSTRVLDCLSENFLYYDLAESDFDIYSKCGLSKIVFEEKGMFYLQVRISSVRDLEPTPIKIEIGNNQYLSDCKIQKESFKTFRKLAQCSYKSMEVYDPTYSKNFRISVIAASDQDKK